MTHTHSATGTTDMIKFNLYNVVNKETGDKAKVSYHISNRVDGRECVTLYEKEYSRNLSKVFAGQATNNSDSMTDYFESTKMVFFTDHPLYEQALAAAKRWEAKWKARRAA